MSGFTSTLGVGFSHEASQTPKPIGGKRGTRRAGRRVQKTKIAQAPNTVEVDELAEVDEPVKVVEPVKVYEPVKVDEPVKADNHDDEALKALCAVFYFMVFGLVASFLLVPSVSVTFLVGVLVLALIFANFGLWGGAFKSDNSVASLDRDNTTPVGGFVVVFHTMFCVGAVLAFFSLVLRMLFATMIPILCLAINLHIQGVRHNIVLTRLASLEAAAAHNGPAEGSGKTPLDTCSFLASLEPVISVCVRTVNPFPASLEAAAAQNGPAEGSGKTPLTVSAAARAAIATGAFANAEDTESITDEVVTATGETTPVTDAAAPAKEAVPAVPAVPAEAAAPAAEEVAPAEAAAPTTEEVATAEETAAAADEAAPTAEADALVTEAPRAADIEIGTVAEFAVEFAVVVEPTPFVEAVAVEEPVEVEAFDVTTVVEEAGEAEVVVAAEVEKADARVAEAETDARVQTAAAVKTARASAINGVDDSALARVAVLVADIERSLASMERSLASMDRILEDTAFVTPHAPSPVLKALYDRPCDRYDLPVRPWVWAPLLDWEPTSLSGIEEADEPVEEKPKEVGEDFESEFISDLDRLLGSPIDDWELDPNEEDWWNSGSETSFRSSGLLSWEKERLLYEAKYDNGEDFLRPVNWDDEE